MSVEYPKLTPDIHGAAKHTDVTRQVFLPANEGTINAGTAAGSAQWATVSGAADLNEPDIYFSMKVPDDFVSFTSIELVWFATPAAGDMRWQIAATYAAAGEINNTHTDLPAYGETVTGGISIINVQEPLNALTLASLAAGDYLGMRILRNGTDALDTINDVVYWVGILFTYEASQ